MSGFTFQWSSMLPLLLLALPLWWLLKYARARRADLIKTMGGGLSTHRRLRDYLRLAAFVLLVLAMARPGYSPVRLSIDRTGRDVVFALDVSQSMLAEDVPPSRLEVAKQAVRDALNIFSNERVGLVVYAGSATILCPLTYDYDFVRYMLEQTHTRSADFGGTTLQSAVEKVVDQVLMADRAGVQDLVVMTDGGDHGSRMDEVSELLQQHGVDLLLLGIGNPNEGSPIPIEDADGVRTLMRSNDEIIYTQLNDASLRTLAAQSATADYVPVGDRVFDLGQVYLDYVAGRDVSVSEAGDGIVVYQEGVLFFIVPALLLLLLSECWGANGLRLGQAGLLLAVLCVAPKESTAATAQIKAQFTQAAQLYADGSFVEAESLFTEIALASDGSTLTPTDLAAVQLNRGLCLIQISRAESEVSAELGLSYAQQAQLALLAAKRYTPDARRSGIRLESCSNWVAELQVRIAETAKQQDEMAQQLEQLVETLQVLLKAQQDLRTEVAADVDRSSAMHAKDTPAPESIKAASNLGMRAAIFVNKQGRLKVEAERIYFGMQQLEASMNPTVETGQPPLVNLITEPLGLMAKVPVSMGLAVDLLANWNSWPAGRAEQQVAEQLIKAILSLLSQQSPEEMEGDEWDEMDEFGEYDYSNEMDESMMSSMPMVGDLTAGGEMQALPVPNYSADDILMEEQGSMQFRQQQRAKANAGKVKKDY